MNTNTSKKRTEDLRNWGNDFNNAYQPPQVSTPSTPPVLPSSEEERKEVSPVNKSESPALETIQKVETPNTKDFKFNPDAKTFVPRSSSKSTSQPVNQPMPGMTTIPNYVLTSMPPNTTMIPNFMPQVPIIYSTPVPNQPIQAPPLFAQPNVVMSNEMQRMFRVLYIVLIKTFQRIIYRNNMYYSNFLVSHSMYKLRFNNNKFREMVYEKWLQMVIKYLPNNKE